MKPSDIFLLTIPPLPGTFNRVENEAAATLMVRACARLGNEWRAVSPREIGEALKADLEEGVEPIRALNPNPFWRPTGFRDLVKLGFAVFVKGDVEVTDPDADGGLSIRFTEKGLQKLQRWVRE